MDIMIVDDYGDHVYEIARRVAESSVGEVFLIDGQSHKKSKTISKCLLVGCEEYTSHNKGYCSPECFKKSRGEMMVDEKVLINNISNQIDDHVKRYQQEIDSLMKERDELQEEISELKFDLYAANEKVDEYKAKMVEIFGITEYYNQLE